MLASGNIKGRCFVTLKFSRGQGLAPQILDLDVTRTFTGKKID
jgi:hypothetical protein